MSIVALALVPLLRAPRALTRRRPQHIFTHGASKYFMLILGARMVMMVIARLPLVAGPQLLDELPPRARCLRPT